MEDLIVRYLQGLATSQEKEMLHAWLKSDSRNKKIFLEYQAIWEESSLTEDMHPEEVNRSFHRFSVNAGIPEENPVKGYRWMKPGRIAAAVALLFACSLGSYYWGANRESHNQMAVVFNQAIMGNESKGRIRLPDGTEVWMNANTQVYYPQVFNPSERHVRMEGEAFFDVTHDSKQPFFVEAGPMTIKVLGTTFNIKSHTGRSTSSAVLLSGKVEVSFTGRKDLYTLLPGQLITYDYNSHKVNIEEVNADEYIIWAQDKLTFEGETVGSVLRKVEKWYDLKITHDGQIPLDKKVSLTIRKENPEEFFDSFKWLIPASYEIREDEIIISGK